MMGGLHSGGARQLSEMQKDGNELTVANRILQRTVISAGLGVRGACVGMRALALVTLRLRQIRSFGFPLVLPIDKTDVKFDKCKQWTHELFSPLCC